MVSTISPGQDPPVRSPRRRDGLVIVHLTAPAPYGGLEQVLCALATGQAATGHRVHVVAVLGPGDDVPAAWRHEFAVAGVQLHTLVIKPRDYLGERRQVHEL